MGHTACTDPQYLYKGALYLYLAFPCFPSNFIEGSVVFDAGARYNTEVSGREKETV
jgi:hypothetical protein